MTSATPDQTVKSSALPHHCRFGVGKKSHLRIVPVFLPFAGCPGQCVFCAQDRQTGQSGQTCHDETHDASLRQQTLASLEALQQRDAQTGQAQPLPELAFYGGTFTALPPLRQAAWLDFYQHCRDAGLAASCRCSTRPDAVAGHNHPLRPLKDAGLGLVELGVQSFDSAALTASRRGYSGQTASQACHAVHGAGLALGIQLLPGMPGVSPEIFLADVQQALALRPACLRFYPCLVPHGTELARLWQAGQYQPWSLESTVCTLGQALAMAWAASVPVIRLAVAPEQDFDASLLAGPRHPALGSLIQAEALKHTVARLLQGQSCAEALLRLPQFCSGFAMGHLGSLREHWQALGVRLCFEARTEAQLELMGPRR